MYSFEPTRYTVFLYVFHDAFLIYCGEALRIHYILRYI